MKSRKPIFSNFLLNSTRTLLKFRKLKPINKFRLGHFYSPVVSKIDLDSYEDNIWPKNLPEDIQGIELQPEQQKTLLADLSKYYNDIPFTVEKSDKYRYYYKNGTYSYTDAIVLHSMIRYYKPNQIIEIGSGFSSSVMLDTREQFAPEIDLTFIEPYPQLLYSLFKENDKKNCTIFDSGVQSVPLKEFKKLQANDILFIDSSHISKTGSDVNYELFEILPSLASGVIIHVHDMFYPFEYPKEWVYEGRNWNELYLIRAFLSYNQDFEILLFSHYMHTMHQSAFEKMPLSYKNKGGNLWLRKK
ncbi:class I SAM-dependent methyltransferase [Aurantibacter crassamenti]|uniref:class I SAM-dependent methyltransferase n=1 Tax=Aurantibacter crassamenti TaxID=1837375 RepID=UPI0019393803|nr:class I SAM-dependent methyltransferase [Aurantibacter crassamenti]MBM1105306.1 class I SAM-dependent methyltransferase [Aurantibacter crassamenti]